MTDRPTVFISYSHKDEVWKDRVVTHLNVLARQEMLEVWDDRKISVGSAWYADIQRAIGQSSAAVLLITAEFLSSKFITEEEIPRLLKLREENALRIFPVIVKHCAWDRVAWLKDIQARPTDGKPLSGETEQRIDAILADFAREVADVFSRAAIAASPPSPEPVPPDKITLAKLPIISGEIIGREQELALLDQAWADPHTHIFSVVAMGGAGKSALVGEWLNRMERGNYRGAVRVYGWSFYSQGAKEGAKVSADEFIAHALKCFGDPDPKEGSAWEKGVRLAELIRKQKTLFILDGLEPLQYPPGESEGKLKDQAVQSPCR